MILRFILIALIIYFGIKFVKDLISPKQNVTEIKKKPDKNKPLDLSNYDVEDADFEEIDD